MPPRVVLTAFEPFEGRSFNRSAEVLARVQAPEGMAIDKRTLPVDFARLPRAVAALLGDSPDALVLLGEAGRSAISVEEVALNVIDARTADNAGMRPRGVPVVPGAPLALASSWTGRAVLEAIRGTGAAVDSSHHAGTLACNAAVYLALASGARCPIGFIHVPAARWPCGPRLILLARAIEAALTAVVRDVRSPG
jgi:pyroglutamyl-peptidase